MTPSPLKKKFDKMEYHSAEYDVFGFPKRMKQSGPNGQILKTDVRQPKDWAPLKERANGRRTKTQMLQQRKQEFRADPSYDLTGDGVVGSREYFIAARFDKGLKGKLT